jgi:hypothetical protein
MITKGSLDWVVSQIKKGKLIDIVFFMLSFFEVFPIKNAIVKFDKSSFLPVQKAK